MRILAFVGIILMMSSASSFASADAKFVQVLSQVLKVTTPPVSGDVPVAVIFDEGSGGGEASANAIASAIAAKPNIAGATLVPSVTPASAFNPAQARIAVLSDQSSSVYQQVFQAAASAGVMTVGAARDCVELALCVIHFDTSSGVKIAVSEAALNESGVSFRSAFMLLVERL